jgi:hypothetical protein
MPAYEKTIWSDGENKYSIRDAAGVVIPGFEDIKLIYEGSTGTPVSSEKMNHIEEGIDNAITQDEARELIAHNAYDDYQLWLELYYKGTISQVEASNAKAIMLDGFLNTSNIESTDALLYSVAYLNNAVALGLTTPTSVSALSGGLGTTFLSSFIDGSTATGETAVAPISGAIYKSGTFDLGTIKAVKAINVYLKGSVSSPQGSVIAQDLEYSPDGLTWIPLGLSGAVSVSTSAVWVNFNFVKYVSARYLRFNLQLYNPYASFTNTFNIYELTVNTGTASLATLISKPKTIPSSVVRADLYLSLIEPIPGSVVPKISFNGGTSYTTMTFVESIPDKKYPTYTEKRFFALASGINMKLKIELDSLSSANVITEIKRYGLILT